MTRQTSLRLVLVVIALGSLGACGAPTVSRGHTEFGYTPGEIQLMARHGPRWFGGTYAVAPDGEPDPRYRLRWLFNLPLGFRSASVCGDGLDEKAAGWTEPTGQVLAVFCRRERGLSFTYGSLGDGLDMDTKAFSKFIGTMGLVLLPRVRQDRDNRCRRFMVCG
jgi:hypothetical protein